VKRNINSGIILPCSSEQGLRIIYLMMGFSQNIIVGLKPINPKILFIPVINDGVIKTPAHTGAYSINHQKQSDGTISNSATPYKFTIDSLMPLTSDLQLPTFVPCSFSCKPSTLVEKQHHKYPTLLHYFSHHTTRC